MAVLALGGVLLRLAFLGSDSFWLDEAYSVTSVLAHGAREIWQTSPDPNHPPLYFFILWVAVRLGGASEAVARLPSALASTLNLVLVYVLCRRLRLSTRAARWAVLLLAFAPVDVWYAQEARMYALVTTTALVFAIGLTLESWQGAILTTAALAVGLYMDFTMVALSSTIISLWLVRWTYTDRRPRTTVLVAAASVVGWLLFFSEWSHLGDVLRRIDTVPLLVNLRRWFGLRIVRGWSAVAIVTLIALVAAALTAVAWSALGRESSRRAWAWIVWAALIGATIAFAFPRGYSAKQFLETGWPFVVIVVAWSLTDALSRSSEASNPGSLDRWRLPVAVGVSIVASIITVMTPRADWRAVVGYLNQRAATTAAIWLDPPWNQIAYDYYKPALVAVPFPLQSAESSLARLEDRRDVCLIAERFGGVPPTSPTEAWLDAHMKLVEAVPFARLQVRCYTK